MCADRRVLKPARCRVKIASPAYGGRLKADTRALYRGSRKEGTRRITGLLTSEAITAFFQVIMIDLVLAGDNAIVIGLAAAGLPPEQRTKAILIGIGAATALRVVFAGITTQLLSLVGLLFAGGLLLLW